MPIHTVRAARAVAALVSALHVAGLFVAPSASASPAVQSSPAADAGVGTLIPGGGIKASSPVLDNFISVLSVSDPNSSGVMTVKFKVKKKIPCQSSVSLSWKYASAARNGGSYDRRSICGSAGTRTHYLRNIPRTIMAVRAVFTFPRPSESRSYTRINNPGTHTRTRIVTKTEAVANAVAMHVPGAVLTFAPQGRVIKFVGKTLLGWTIFKDVKYAITGKSTPCPRLATGQNIWTQQWTTRSGNKVVVKARHKVWKNSTAKANNAKPLCDVTYTVGSYY
jgi:hypothetical protein